MRKLNLPGEDEVSDLFPAMYNFFSTSHNKQYERNKLLVVLVSLALKYVFSYVSGSFIVYGNYFF